MAYIEKKVSCQAVIAKLYRTIKPSDSTWIAGAIEDIGWAIQAIGYHVGFEQKQTPDNEPIVITGHRAKLPCDCERVLFVEQYTDETLDANLMDAEGNSITPGVPPNNECKRTVRLRLGTDLRSKSFSSSTKPHSLVLAAENYYDLQGDFVITGYEEGKLKVHYIGFATDKEGMPLIVDDFNYKTAIFWYVLGNLIMGGHKVPDINFDYCDSKFEYHKNVAKNNVKMPSIDGMESFASSFLRTSRNSTRYGSFDLNIEQPEYKDF